MAQENRNLCLTKEKLLDKYLYTEIHKIFFCTFPIKLYKWIAKLADDQGRWRFDGSIVWTPELMRRLEASKYKIMHIVDHWLDRVIIGFVIEFTVNTSMSYNEAE